MANPEHIHVATLIRLTVTTNALELAAHDLDRLISRLPRDDGRGPYRETLDLVRSALAIARGQMTEVPAALRERSTDPLMHDTAALGRFLRLGVV